jgi:hypothetical protein
LAFFEYQEAGAMTVKIATIAFAWVTTAGLAVAQSNPPATLDHPPEILSQPGPTSPSAQIRLTSAQKTAILDAVRQENKQIAPGTNFVVSVGGAVPPQLELYILPDRALSTVPDAKSMKYTVVQNQIVLVDPTTMRVVDVIPQ